MSLHIPGVFLRLKPTAGILNQLKQYGPEGRGEERKRAKIKVAGARIRKDDQSMAYAISEWYNLLNHYPASHILHERKRHGFLVHHLQRMKSPHQKQMLIDMVNGVRDFSHLSHGQYTHKLRKLQIAQARKQLYGEQPPEELKKDTAGMGIGRGQSLSLPTLDNTQIDHFFQKVIRDPAYRSACTKDKLDHFAPQRCFVIVNSSSSSDPSSGDYHWTTVNTSANPTAAYFFDSYGADPNQEEYNFLQRTAKKLRMQIFQNDSDLQPMNTDSCGWFCIYVNLQLQSGRSFPSVISEFNQSIKEGENEKKLANFFHTTQICGKSLFDCILHKLKV